MSFADMVSYEETGEKFQRVDLTPYREVFDNLRPGITATLIVPTGDLNKSNKGELAAMHDRNFRKVASERGVGLQSSHTNMPDGQTRLRLTVQKKREFPPETMAKRQKALELSREKRSVDKLMIDHPEWTREETTKQYRAAKRLADAQKKS
jgi:hypothetical protein